MSRVQQSAVRETHSVLGPTPRWGLTSGRRQFRPHFPFCGDTASGRSCPLPALTCALEWDELAPTGDDYNREGVVAERSGSPPPPPGARDLAPMRVPRLSCFVTVPSNPPQGLSFL